MSIERINISKKLKFEVLKRDKFTCRYCGRFAPNVILEIDHIKPVYEGGETHILNLITSCFDCNRGKGKTLLSDETILNKQLVQLKELEERRQQIEMMMEWYDSLKGLQTLKLDKIIELLNNKGQPFKLSDNETKRLEKYIKDYELLEILEAIDCSFDYYFDRAFKNFHKKKKEFEYHENMANDKEKRYFTNPNSWKIDGMALFLNKFPGVLKNKRKERKDPDYPFILQVYKYNKENSFNCYDYGFSFLSLEKNYKRLKMYNINAEKCVALMCYKKWYDSNEMIDFINEKIKEIPLDFPIIPC